MEDVHVYVYFEFEQLLPCELACVAVVVVVEEGIVFGGGGE